MSYEYLSDKPLWEALREATLIVLALIERADNNSDWKRSTEYWGRIEAFAASAQEVTSDLETLLREAEVAVGAPLPEDAEALRQATVLLREARSALEIVPVLGSMQANQAANDVAIQRSWELRTRQQIAAQSVATNLTNNLSQNPAMHVGEESGEMPS